VILSVQHVAQCDVAIQPDAFKRRAEAVESAKFIQSVTSEFAFNEAAAVSRELAGLRNEVEKSRKEAKAPVLDLGKKIDGAAAEFLAPIEAESARLRGEMTKFQAEQDRLRMEAERKRREEEEKVRRAEEARLAEIRRQEEEARRAEANARNEAERRAAEERRKEMAAQAEAEAAAAKQRQESAPVSVFVPQVKAAGVSVRKDWDFEITDIAAFAAAYPDLVTITPKRSDVLALLRNGTRELKGARVFEATKIGVRA